MMQFSDETISGYYVVNVSGRLDATTAGEFDGQAESWPSRDEKSIVVDFSGLEYISSAGLRSLLAAGKKVRARGGDILFCGLRGMVADVFDMSGFTSIFKTFENREQALAGLQ
jgi:anti-sigma B factor antagonist